VCVCKCVFLCRQHPQHRSPPALRALSLWPSHPGLLHPHQLLGQPEVHPGAVRPISHLNHVLHHLVRAARKGGHVGLARRSQVLAARKQVWWCVGSTQLGAVACLSLHASGSGAGGHMEVVFYCEVEGAD